MANTDFGRLHEILEKLWWRMRELVYEEKPAPKRRGRARKRNLAGAALPEGDETDLVSSAAYLASSRPHASLHRQTLTTTPLSALTPKWEHLYLHPLSLALKPW